MAVGDVVSVMQNSDIYYQPAAGVEVMITSGGVQNDANFAMGLTNGTNISLNYYNSITTGWESYQPKIFINNSLYLYVGGGGATYRSFCGIQIK